MKLYCKALVALTVLLLSCKSQSCTEKFMELSLLTHRAGQIPDIPDAQTPTLETLYLDDEIRLLRDIAFTCPTTINSILLGANVQSVQDTRDQYPSIILVREVVGGTIVILAERTIYYTTENVSTNGVYNYSLNPPIEANVRDMLGIKAPGGNTSVVTIHYDILNNTGINIEDQLVLAYPLTDQDCVADNNIINSGIVSEKSRNINGVAAPKNHQFIFPELRFSCNGSISKWIFGATREIVQARTELQIWRQTGPDTYTKQDFSLVTANETASPNVHEYYPNTTLQFQEGDVLGVYYGEGGPIIHVQDGNGPLNLEHILVQVDLPTELSKAQLTVAARNNFPLILPVVAINSDSTQSSSTATLAPAVTMTSNTASNNDYSILIAIVVAVIVGSILLAIVVAISVTIVVAISVTIACIRKRKSKSQTDKNNPLPVPEYETLDRSKITPAMSNPLPVPEEYETPDKSKTTPALSNPLPVPAEYETLDRSKKTPAIDIELYSTIDYTTMDSALIQKCETPLKTNTDHLDSPDKTKNGGHPLLSHYTSLNVQELDKDNTYTIPLTPPPSPRKPHPTPYSTPASLPQVEGEENNIYDYATTVRVKEVAGNKDDADYI